MSTDQDRPAAPAASAESENVTRRVFVRLAVAAAGCGYVGLVGYPVYSYLASPVPFDKAFPNTNVTSVDLTPDYRKLPLGTAKPFFFGLEPALLIHLPNDEWSALSTTCTHAGCPVSYQKEENRIFCQCHGGVYNPSNGDNIAGPPPKPLQKYKVEVSETSLKVSKG